jgi:hypothetical protein
MDVSVDRRSDRLCPLPGEWVIAGCERLLHGDGARSVTIGQDAKSVDPESGELS